MALDEIRNTKIKKVEELRKSGTDPYPASSSRTNSVKEAIVPIPYINNITYKPVGDKKEEEEAVLVLSDVYVGKVTKSYNPKIFKERLDKVKNGMLRIVELLRNGYSLNTLNIILGGDIVDGEGIYPTQAMSIDQGALKQVFQTGVPEFSNMFINFLKYFFCLSVNLVSKITSNRSILLSKTSGIAACNTS